MPRAPMGNCTFHRIFDEGRGKAMNLASYLATAKVVGGLLDQLASPTPDAELLEDAGLATSPALRAFAARTWAADRRRTMVVGPQDLVLLVAYQTTLHTEQVRYQ